MDNECCILISLDAVGKKDYNCIKDLPNFKFLMENGSYSFDVKSIYPTLTYPAHATIVTGKYPKNHGIINNFLTEPEKEKADWYWFRNYIKGDTIYDLVKQSGRITASILWPVTAKANIDYNMPEILPHKKWQNQIIVSLLNGSKYFQFDMNRRYGYMREGIKQPNLDNFSMACTLDVIKRYKPDLVMVHLTDVDSFAHKYGRDSSEINKALSRHDERLGVLLRLLKEKEMIKKTNIIVLGDHSFKDVNKVVKLNKLFLKNNLLEVNEKNLITNWKVYMNTCDGSCYIYLNKEEKNNSTLKNKVKNLILDYSKKNNNFIERLLTSEEAASFGADPNCTFMLEANEGYYFLTDLDGDIIQDVGSTYDKGTHGYCPNKKDYETFFMAVGPSIKKNFSIGTMNLVDIAPTLSKILNIHLKDTDGKAINIFK